MKEVLGYLLMLSGLGLQFSIFHCIYGMKMRSGRRALLAAPVVLVLFFVSQATGGAGNQSNRILLLTLVWCLVSVNASALDVLRLVLLNMLVLASVQTFLKYAVLLQLFGDREAEQRLVNEMLLLVLIWLKQLFIPKKTIPTNRMGKAVYAVLYTALGLFLFFTSGIIYALGVLSDYRMHMAAILALCMAGVVASIFAVGAVILIDQRERLRMHLHMESQFREEQEKYYLKLLEKDEETRAFRHDIVGQLVGIRAQLEAGQISKAKAHMDDLYGEISQIQKKLPDVGNEMINAILNYYLGDEELQVTVTGRLQRDIPMRDADLCVVISNVVKNAAEAARQAEGEKEVRVEVRQGERTVLFEIVNTYNGKSQMVKGGWKTTKEDKRNHGFGLRNAERVMERYDGELSFEQDERRVTTRILLRG